MCYPHAYGGYASVRWYASTNPVHTPVSFTPDWHENRVMHIICTLEIRERHYLIVYLLLAFMIAFNFISVNQILIKY